MNRQKIAGFASSYTQLTASAIPVGAAECNEAAIFPSQLNK